MLNEKKYGIVDFFPLQKEWWGAGENEEFVSQNVLFNLFHIVFTNNKALYPLVSRFLSFEDIKIDFTSLSRMLAAFS